jgi:hypothetical protein
MPILKLIWGPDQEQNITASSTPPRDEARTWLDEQYIAFDCAPTRASGKVLVADKLLVVAEAAGEQQFADAAWAAQFAAVAAAMTSRDLITIDLPGRSVGY